MDNQERASKPRSKEYPAVKLEEAISFVAKFKDYPTGKPIGYTAAAKECGVSPSTKSFRYTISTAKQFGLISTAAGLTFTLLESAYRLVRPTENDAALQQLKLECFRNPKLYAELIDEYEGRSVPSVGIIENLMVNYHSIMPAVAKKAAQVFVDTANEVGAIQNGVLCMDVSTNDPPTSGAVTSRAEEEFAAQDEVLSKDTQGQNVANVGMLLPESEDFAAPLNIPFGDKRRAVLYLPIDATKEDAEYVRDMIDLMLKRVYKVD